ncbi:MAG TPA: Slp family lipoprotein [Gammaproteobacteria bacterium]|nr:Slp family lipoprotein [Gammaproteobacteria bacterium]
MNRCQIILLTIGTGLLAACASSPRAINMPGSAPINVAAVQQSPKPQIGKQVRWGGRIAHVTNLKTSTEVEIVSRPLSSGGRPRENDQTSGRFIAILDGFVDPDVYAKNREITVRGTITGLRGGKIGDFTYRYPVIQAQAHELWEKRQPISRYEPYPWLYDPWFSPYFYSTYPHHDRW